MATRKTVLEYISRNVTVTEAIRVLLADDKNRVMLANGRTMYGYRVEKYNGKRLLWSGSLKNGVFVYYRSYRGLNPDEILSKWDIVKVDRMSEFAA